MGCGNMKVRTSGALSCHSCSASRSTTLFLRCVCICRRENSCSHFRRACRFKARPHQGFPRSVGGPNYTQWQGSKSIEKEKPAPGTMPESAPYISPRMAEPEPDVWNPRGVKILGTRPNEFVQNKLESRLEDERSLWEAVSLVLDFQCAWQILLQCASPRCHHLLRTVEWYHRSMRKRSSKKDAVRFIQKDTPIDETRWKT